MSSQIRNVRTESSKIFRPNLSKIVNSLKDRDKPHLYDQLLSLKQNFQSIKEDNFLLKSRLHQLQQSKAKKSQMIKELQMRIKNPGLKGALNKDL